MEGKLPNPERVRHPELGLLTKVFIVYAHNPEPYRQIQPPGQADVQQLLQRDPSRTEDAIWQAYEQECLDHERRRDEAIALHEKQVFDFASFLRESCIAVAYDRLLDDKGAPNKLKWSEQQIADSDYVLLIVTPSLLHFLHQAPEDEFIFRGDYLYNLLHHTPPGLGILPIFLNRCKDLALLPKAREASTLYEVHSPFEVASGERPDDLITLYRVLTRQPAFVQPAAKPQAVVRIKPKKSCKSDLCLR